MIIVLFGVSNVGKTTTARNLAKLLGYQFVDVDESIRKRYEITESVFLRNYELVNRKLQQIKEKGIRISLDDFGTGFSSLSRLRDMNIDIVKIDKYFIDKIVDHGEDKLITADIISMAHKFGLQAVAEGVEERKQMDYLKKYHCDVVQGYYISKPLSQNDAILFLQGD
ncbi:EAL domain-containing protein [Proteiniclasticum ruminis]|uniref:Shikimate kinase n=1 Tax=Proteiniclasticum ruminis TaxID=398199 RepID=A0A1G8IEP2_9CLOT|nr:EAL domain-containing protein [Proteiniclasticum ruminis]SDI17376.1 Shikimate kinase [Proteiniclasticum ruminis]